MGNDNKITEEEKSNQIHKEVMLFLGKELERIHQTSTEQTYDIEREYAKSKKHHSPFSFFMLVISFIVVLSIAVIITKTISAHNEEISVSVAVFDDLNLKNLLDTVGVAQTNYDNAVKNRASIESDMSVKLKAVEDEHTNDIFVIDSMSRLTKKRRESLIDEAEIKYKAALAAVHEEYDAKLIQAEREVEEYKSQLAAFDAAKIEAAKEKEKALDSERRVKELEQKKIKDQYESRIAELNKKIADTQRKNSDDMRNAVSSVSSQYQAEIAMLDPKLKDNAADEIIKEANTKDSSDFSGAESLAEKNISSAKVSDAVSKYQTIYDDYKYLDSAVAAIPQKNSIPSYVSASHKLVNEMGEVFVDTTAAFYNETLALNGKINSLTNELAESRKQTETVKQNMADQKAVYEESYEALMTIAKTSAILISASDYDNMPVYVAGKARYLISEEGADAEFKIDKATIKGKILRKEDDSFYFSVGNDKDGNLLAVDFALVVPGTLVKILSK